MLYLDTLTVTRTAKFGLMVLEMLTPKTLTDLKIMCSHLSDDAVLKDKSRHFQHHASEFSLVLH